MRAVFFLPILLLIACKKPKKAVEPLVNKTCATYANQDCADGDLYIGNKTNDVVTFGWTWENEDAHIILPGKTLHFKTGHVKALYDANCNQGTSSTAVWGLTSSEGSWAINVDHCAERADFEYMDGSTELIELVDVTDYTK